MFASRIYLPLTAALLMGCATTSAPRGWLDPAPESSTMPYGGWLDARYVLDSQTGDAAGELIAIDRDSVYILPDRGPLMVLPRAAVTRGRLMAYDPSLRLIGSWTRYGILGTSTALFVALASLGDSDPVDFLALAGMSSIFWVPAGLVSAILHSYLPRLSYPRRPWQRFKEYARFPQGLPGDLDPRALTPKPHVL